MKWHLLSGTVGIDVSYLDESAVCLTVCDVSEQAERDSI